jgi:hypothetical protein
MSRKLVAAIGCINAGKDCISRNAACRLITKGCKSVYVNKFASSLNGAVASILGIDEKELQDRELKEKKRFIFQNPKKEPAIAWSSRDVQKEIGSVLRNNLGEDVFVNALDRHYSDPYYNDAIIFISDLRYQNELEWVRKQGGKVVYIHNEAAAQTQKARESIPDDKHYPPESELLQWDFYNRAETPDYWLDNNDFDNHSHFDDFVEFVLDYLEK